MTDRVQTLEEMLREAARQLRRIAASTTMTRPAMREGAAELATEIEDALARSRQCPS